MKLDIKSFGVILVVTIAVVIATSAAFAGPI
jgi:hypothetical protein